MKEVMVQGMEAEVDVINFLVDIIVVVHHATIGEMNLTKAAIEWGRADPETVVAVVNQSMGIAQVVLGAAGGMRDAAAVAIREIQMINIWAEANQDDMKMIIIVPEEAAEAETVETPVWEDKAVLFLQADVAGAAISGNIILERSSK